MVLLLAHVWTGRVHTVMVSDAQFRWTDGNAKLDEDKVD